MAKDIKTELKQVRPFPSLAEEAFVALMRTADQLQWKGAELLKQFDISPTQYNALRILRGAGPTGLPCSEIGGRMVNRDSDITRLLDRLEKRKLTERCRDSKDRRVITARITAAGLDLLKTMDKPLDQFHSSLLGTLGEKRLREMLRMLEEARATAE